MHGNLSQALYCVTVALPLMRAQKDGVLIHTASMAGRFIGGFRGPIYGAAKHGVVAMSHTINMQECINGIRSTVFLPGEVATPILDKRPNPVGPEERARMVQSEDCGDLIRYIACLPKHVVMSEVMLAPTLQPRPTSPTCNANSEDDRHGFEPQEGHGAAHDGQGRRRAAPGAR